MDIVDVMSFGNWRGYRGIWELADDALYLVGFEFGFGGLGLERLFPDRVKDGKVLADWYNSKLIIPKGNVLRWDGIFSRTSYIPASIHNEAMLSGAWTSIAQ